MKLLGIRKAFLSLKMPGAAATQETKQMEAQLLKLLKANDVHEDIIKFMETKKCFSIKTFANWVDEKKELQALRSLLPLLSPLWLLKSKKKRFQNTKGPSGGASVSKSGSHIGPGGVL